MLEVKPEHVKHLFVFNPKSFWNNWKQDQVQDRIRSFFQEIGNNNYEIHISRFPRDASGFIPAVAKNLPAGTKLRVYAVGGDGILFDCLNGIMRLKNTELAAIPYGRANSFIRGFGKNNITLFRKIPLQYKAPAIPIDVIRCGNNYTLSRCNIGAEAETIRFAAEFRNYLEKGSFVSRWLVKHFHTLIYYGSSIAVFTRNKKINQHYEMEIDGKKQSGVYQGLHFYNAPYTGKNMYMIKEAMPNDGLLDMLTINCRGVLKILKLLFLYATGRYKIFPGNFTHKKLQKIVILSEDILRISLDGFVFYEAGLVIELLPAAVQFIDAAGHGYAEVNNG
jgi:diacylglycerol kinase family enzyme